MASRKIRDLVVKVGEYQDRNTNETKGRFENVGSLMQNDEDQSYFISMKRTFNPAGVPNPENRDTIYINCYVPKDKRQGQGGGQSQSQQNDTGVGQKYAEQAGGYHPDLDDETPF